MDKLRVPVPGYHKLSKNTSILVPFLDVFAEMAHFANPLGFSKQHHLFRFLVNPNQPLEGLSQPGCGADPTKTLENDMFLFGSQFSEAQTWLISGMWDGNSLFWKPSFSDSMLLVGCFPAGVACGISGSRMPSNWGKWPKNLLKCIFPSKQKKTRTVNDKPIYQYIIRYHKISMKFDKPGIFQ